MHSTSFFCLGIVFYLFCTDLCSAQPFIDIVSIAYRYYPGVEYQYQTGKLRIEGLTCSLTLPVEFKNKNALILGGTYERLEFNRIEQDQHEHLNSLNLQIGYLHHIKKIKSKLLILAIPKLSSDRVKLRQSAFQQAVLGVYSYQRNKELAYKLGFYYSKEFFGNFYMPLVGLEWRPHSKFWIYGLFPANATIEYKFTNNVYTGIAYSNFTQSYRVLGTELFVRNGDPFWGNMHFRCFLNYYYRKYWVGFTEIGYTLFRSYDLYKVNNDKIIAEHFFQPARNGTFFTLGIAFRVRVDG